MKLSNISQLMQPIKIYHNLWQPQKYSKNNRSSSRKPPSGKNSQQKASSKKYEHLTSPHRNSNIIEPFKEGMAWSQLTTPNSPGNISQRLFSKASQLSMNFMHDENTSLNLEKISQRFDSSSQK